MSILGAIDELSDDERRQCLLPLQQAEFLYERQTAPERIFAFKHALTQDVAHVSLIVRTRQNIHRRIANALESEFQPLVRGRPELLAHHLTGSGEMQRAIGYWLQAGQRAVERSANAEAIAHLTKGLELLETLPDSAERAEREIALQLTLGVPLLSTRGHGSPEAEQAYRRASDLCRASGDTLSLFFATWGLARLTNEVQPRYVPELHGNQAFLVAGHDPCVCAHLTAARILWVTGYPDQAAIRSEHARNLANKLSHPSSVGIALNRALRFYARGRDAQSARLWLEPLRTLAAEHGFAGHAAWRDLVQVWLDARQRGTGEGITEMRRLLASGPELAGLKDRSPRRSCGRLWVGWPRRGRVEPVDRGA